MARVTNKVSLGLTPAGSACPPDLRRTPAFRARPRFIAPIALTHHTREFCGGQRELARGAERELAAWEKSRARVVKARRKGTSK